jgi:hypothetical protein
VRESNGLSLRFMPDLILIFSAVDSGFEVKSCKTLSLVLEAITVSEVYQL